MPAGHSKNRVEVEGGFREIGEPVEAGVEVGGLAGLDEAEMALGQDEARLAREGAEHRQADPRQPCLDETTVARARDLVEDHARDPDPRIIGRAAERHGRR